MPALLVDTNTSSTTNSNPVQNQSDGSASPDRPPVSPITPTATDPVAVPQLAPLEPTATRPCPPPPPVATFRPQPTSVAISESDNPDVIALRSAISLLQLQREKSKRDLKALAELKTVAVSDPSGFAQSLQKNRAHPQDSYPDILAPTLAGLADAPSDDEPDVNVQQSATDARKDSADVGNHIPAPKFPEIPQPQNIVRCPPVNWAKYHIVGEPLDKMHQEQKKWPGHAEPPRNQSGARLPPHSIAAPYSPFTDGIGKPPSASQPPKGSKKSPS